MSAKRTGLLRLALAAIALVAAVAAVAADDDVPDSEFLEYLGSWDESDEDWLVAERVGALRREEGQLRSDPEADADRSTEKDPENDDEI